MFRCCSSFSFSAYLSVSHARAVTIDQNVEQQLADFLQSKGIEVDSWSMWTPAPEKQQRQTSHNNEFCKQKARDSKWTVRFLYIVSKHRWSNKQYTNMTHSNANHSSTAGNYSYMPQKIADYDKVKVKTFEYPVEQLPGNGTQYQSGKKTNPINSWSYYTGEQFNHSIKIDKNYKYLLCVWYVSMQ